MPARGEQLLHESVLILQLLEALGLRGAHHAVILPVAVDSGLAYTALWTRRSTEKPLSPTQSREAIMYLL
jgi:hypothetical protein